MSPKVMMWAMWLWGRNVYAVEEIWLLTYSSASHFLAVSAFTEEQNLHTMQQQQLSPFGKPEYVSACSFIFASESEWLSDTEAEERGAKKWTNILTHNIGLSPSIIKCCACGESYAPPPHQITYCHLPPSPLPLAQILKETLICHPAQRCPPIPPTEFSSCLNT